VTDRPPPSHRAAARLFDWLPVALLLLAITWYAALVVRFHTFGAIGTDPATYVQMAASLAQRGTVVKEFPLFTNLYNKGFSWDALIPTGYHVVRETGAIAPNFAFGFPVLLAVGMRFFGEAALDWVTPLLGALSLLAMFALGNELLRWMPVPRRRTISALAVLFLATSPKQIQLSLVPMSDVPTQLFCVLAIWCATRMTRPVGPRADSRAGIGGIGTSRVLLAVLCGIGLGFAYLIRHSALALAVPLGILAARWSASPRARLVLILVAMSTFGITILPDLIYHQQVLGGLFRPESPESAELVLADGLTQGFATVVALGSLTGFGPVVLLAPVGWWILARGGHSFQALVLAAWVLAFVAFHAPLRLTGVFENSLRYLVPAYPALALAAAIGVVAVLETALGELAPWRRRLREDQRWVRVVVWFGAGIAVIALASVSLRALAGPDRFAARAYGWTSQQAREDMARMRSELPAEAIIGVSDQMAGATALYLEREVFRPGTFVNGATEFERFAAEHRAGGRSIWLLGDWACSQIATPDESLPTWLATFPVTDQALEIEDLPYECAQKLWQVRQVR
jgi:hypothetical protein